MTYDASGTLLKEKQINAVDSVIETRDYISGNEYVDAEIESVYHSEGRAHFVSTSWRYEYILKDHLGNSRVVYYENNDVLELLAEHHFYPHGMKMNGPWASVPPDAISYQFNGIDYVDDFGLNVNMATFRTLDPATARWWSVDPETELMTGYTPYCAMNGSPLMYSDPEGDLGFFAAAGIGAGLGLISNGLSNAFNNQPFFQGAGRAAAFGAIRSALSYGIGSAFGATGSFGHEFGRALTHGFSGGFISAIQGGSFGSGFLSGAISSSIGSGIDALGGGAGAQFLGGGLAGGIGSAISGGSFWEGLGIGLAIGGLNHALHSLNSGGPPWEYNGQEYYSETDLYLAILADEAWEQLGIKDIAALTGIAFGQPTKSKRFITKGSSPGTSPISSYLSKRMGTFKKGHKAPVGTPKVLGGKGIRMTTTKSVGRFVGRWIPFLGWGILAYDASMIIYNTQTKYNAIVGE